MPGLIGKKIGMTSVFSADGKNVPCTVIEAGPCVVTQIKTLEKDGYDAIQLGFSEKSEKHTNKAEAGLFKKVGVAPQRHLVEFKGFEGDIKVGDVITVDMFGGVGQSTHGQHNRLRAPGSIGACSYPAKVFKGMRMAGQTGNARVTVENLEILKLIPENNLILIKGSVPGAKGSIVIVNK